MTGSPAPGSAGPLVAELRAITTALHLGGLDTLAASTITRTERGVLLTIPTGAAQPERSHDVC